MSEEWKDIEGYEGDYMVSNWGNVKSLERLDSLGHLRKERILKNGKDKYGYLRVTLCKDGKTKTYQIHRLVANEFIPNPNNLPMINHKDENPSNNNVDNLEWCSCQYNNNYGSRNQRIGDKLTNGSCSKTVYQYTLNGELVKEWQSLHEVERQLGLDYSYIGACCNGKWRTAYGYIWTYNTLDSLMHQERIIHRSSKTVYQYTLDGEFIKKWSSMAEVQKQLGYNKSNIAACCRGKYKQAYGYIWRYRQ